MKRGLKIEYRRRLERLSKEINQALVEDDVNKGLLPALYSVLSYHWCKNSDDLTCNFKESLRRKFL